MNKDVTATFKLKREELADFLKTRRVAVQSNDVALPENLRKLTPGLRRKDVAELANLSTSWYSWLKQTREIRILDDPLNSIAATHRLSDADHSHLFNLAKPNNKILKPENAHDFKEIKRVLNSFASDIPTTQTRVRRKTTLHDFGNVSRIDVRFVVYAPIN